MQIFPEQLVNLIAKPIALYDSTGGAHHVEILVGWQRFYDEMNEISVGNA